MSSTHQPHDESHVAPSAPIASVFAIVVTVAAVVLLGLRLRYGVDIRDESYYAAVSYRFALGMRPLLDDLSAHQFASYLVTPLVSAWMAVFGGLDGIMIALRFAYFGAALGAAGLAFVLLRRIVDWRLALLATACSLGFVPYMWFTLSYNTITLIALSVATSLAGLALTARRDAWWLFVLSGCALGLAVAAYPPHIITAAVAIVLLGVLSRSWRVSAAACGGAVLVLLAFVWSLAGTFSGLADIIAYNRFASPWAGYLDLLPKALILARGAVGATYLAPATYLILVMVAFRLLRLRVPLAITALLPVAVLAAIHVDYAGLRTLNAASLLLLAAIASGYPGVGGAHRRALTFSFGVAACASLLMAYTSNTGFTAFGVGAAAVSAPAMAVLLGNAFDELGARTGQAKALSATVAIGAVSTAVIVALCWSYAQREPGYPWQLRTPATGVNAGLLTSEANAEQLRRIDRLLSATTSASDRLYVYNREPGIHLYTAARPVAPFMFYGAEGGSEPLSRFVIGWLGRPGHQPTVVLVDADAWERRATNPRDYIIEYVDREFTPVATGTDYVILKPR
ncbi:MAG: hypothetical protein HGB10_05135 [Coriobacteriia bacterium]|nr:hypothetical protein [Coriobacteriia bacterium]